MANRNPFLILSLIILLAYSGKCYTQPVVSDAGGFVLSAENVIFKNEKVLEFDLYLLNTNLKVPFELALIQLGILVNPDINSGGNISASIVEGSSQLKEEQKPLTILYSQKDHIIKLPARTLKPLSIERSGDSRGTLISQLPPGTRICRISLTNTVAFSNVTEKLTFNFSKQPYSTAVYQYIAGVNTPAPCNNSNCIVKP